MSSALPSFTWSVKTLPALAVLLAASTACNDDERLSPNLLSQDRRQSQTVHPAQSAQPTSSAATSANASHLVAAARQALLNHRSVTARLRLSTTAWGSDVAGTGRYLQGPGTSNRARLELVLRSQAIVFSWQQVADGTWLWTHRQFGDDTALERAAIPQPGAAERPAGDASPSADSQVRASPKPSTAGLACGLASLPGNLHGLLATIDTYWELTGTQPDALHGRPMWLVRGTPREAAWHSLFTRLRGNGESLTAARRHAILPGKLRLWLGQHDLFPYRLVLEQAAQSTLLFGNSNSPVMLDLELYDVQFDLPLKAQLFEYDPGENPFVDVTGRYTTSNSG